VAVGQLGLELHDELLDHQLMISGVSDLNPTTASRRLRNSGVNTA